MKKILRTNAKAQGGGFTLVELLISLFIIVLAYQGISKLGRDVFFLNGVIQNNANAEIEVRQAFKNMTKEMRSMNTSNSGSYPLASAASSSVTFFYDVNGDGKNEQIRYYLSGTSLNKGVIIPTGNPLTYVASNESTSTVMHNIYNGSAGVFDYYDTNYTGTSTPLAFPVNVSSVRLIRISLLVNPNVARSASTTTFTTQVSMRNLKDNL